ncbi:MAG: hypothetical protein IK033_05160, partial [Verrucomicrobia bacterium]|nr:hypothetical protein [Verrucomicrobiota bacterium]
MARDQDWESSVSWLRIFSYVTVRVAGAALTSFLLSLFFGGRIIRWLREIAAEHYVSLANMGSTAKVGTPTMGGIMIVGFLDISVILWGVWNELLILTSLSMIVLAGLGFYDDYRKITSAQGEGIGEWLKIVV